MSEVGRAAGSVTIHDVADRAGVSIKTVSRVMNLERAVAAETRARVLATASALDYRPNVSARSLAGSRAYLLGVVFDNPSAHYVAGVQLGAAAACRAAGRHLVVEALDSHLEDVAAAVGRLIAAVRTDGLILTPPLSDNLEVIGLLEDARVPFVRIAAAVHPERGARVFMDDARAMRELTRHVLELGHRRIGFIRGPENRAATHQRFAGFLSELQSGGLEVAPERIAAGDFTFRSGLAAAERLLTGRDRVTAIVASNDDMALGAMAFASRMGLVTPDDLSVTGFDDTPAAEVIWPRLTTIRQPLGPMAAAAVAMLITRAADAAAERLVPFELIVRESTGRAPTARRAGRA